MGVVRYWHNGREMHVREDLKGLHAAHNLCFMCARFRPEAPDVHCGIAMRLREFCRRHGVVAPVWECSHFVERNGL